MDIKLSTYDYLKNLDLLSPQGLSYYKQLSKDIDSKNQTILDEEESLMGQIINVRKDIKSLFEALLSQKDVVDQGRPSQNENVSKLFEKAHFKTNQETNYVKSLEYDLYKNILSDSNFIGSAISLENSLILDYKLTDRIQFQVEVDSNGKFSKIFEPVDETVEPNELSDKIASKRAQNHTMISVFENKVFDEFNRVVDFSS